MHFREFHLQFKSLMEENIDKLIIICQNFNVQNFSLPSGYHIVQNFDSVNNCEWVGIVEKLGK